MKYVIPKTAICNYCHSSKELTRDHIVPKSRGGGNGPKNLQVLCKRCNSLKGKFTDKEVSLIFKAVKLLKNRNFMTFEMWLKDIENRRIVPLKFEE